jgi:hypothetical protein
LQGADFHIGDGESSEEAFNNPVFLQGWVIPPFLLQKGQRGTAAFAHRRANALWCLSSDERRNNLGVLAGRAHVDTFEWLTVLGPRLLRWLVG